MKFLKAFTTGGIGLTLKVDDFDQVEEGIRNQTVVTLSDYFGERCVFNGKAIAVAFTSSDQSRELYDAFEKALADEEEVQF